MRISNSSLKWLAALSLAATSIGYGVHRFNQNYRTHATHPLEMNSRDSIVVNHAIQKEFSQKNDVDILIINMPDNKRDGLDTMGYHYYSNRKNDLYDKLQDLKQNADEKIGVFAYGTNDPNSSIFIPRFIDALKGLQKSNARRKVLFITGHGNMHGLAGDMNSSSGFVTYTHLADTLNDFFADQNLEMFLFPCGTGGFADEIKRMPKTGAIKTYFAAGSGQKSNPFDSLNGMDDIAKSSIQKKSLLSFEEMAVILSSNTRYHGEYCSPGVIYNQGDSVLFHYRFGYDVQDSLYKKALTPAQKNPFKRALLYQENSNFTRKLCKELDTAKHLGYLLKREKYPHLLPAPIGKITAPDLLFGTNEDKAHHRPVNPYKQALLNAAYREKLLPK